MSHCYGVRDKCCSRGDVCPNLIGLDDPVWFREFGGRPREPAQTCKSFIRCGRFSAMAGLSFAMRPRDCAIIGARNRVPDWETPAMGGKRTPHFSCVALRKRRFVPWPTDGVQRRYD